MKTATTGRSILAAAQQLVGSVVDEGVGPNGRGLVQIGVWFRMTHGQTRAVERGCLGRWSFGCKMLVLVGDFGQTARLVRAVLVRWICSDAAPKLLFPSRRTGIHPSCVHVPGPSRSFLKLDFLVSYFFFFLLEHLLNLLQG